jgi:hypothetical protein
MHRLKVLNARIAKSPLTIVNALEENLMNVLGTYKPLFRSGKT